jgi:hypothetical protein
MFQLIMDSKKYLTIEMVTLITFLMRIIILYRKKANLPKRRKRLIVATRKAKMDVQYISLNLTKLLIIMSKYNINIMIIY